jgi:hypothetical protein
MNWHYAVGGQQQGPVDDAQLDVLIQSGQINQDTLVWREGMPSWQPLRQARPSPAAGAAPPVYATPAPSAGAQPTAPDEVVCAECGKIFTRDNAIQYGATWVCAGCKPVFLQKLREGAVPGGALQSATGTYVDPETLLARVTSREYSVDIGSCLGRAWELTKANFWLLVGATLVVHFCQGAAGAIPFLGYCAGPVLQGPLMGGLYLLYLKLARKEDGQFGDAFSGFSNFVQLMLVSVVTTILIYAWFVPAFACFFFSAQSRNESLMIVAAILALVALPGAAYFGIAWILAFLLVVDKKYEFWTALNVSRKIVNKCWWSMLGLMIVVFLIQLLGFLALCVGIFVTLTLIYGSVVYAYEDIVRGESPQ